MTGAGEPASWADIARRVFALAGHDPSRVAPVSTAEYFATAEGPVAVRPQWSVLDLSKIEATGFRAMPWEGALQEYTASL